MEVQMPNQETKRKNEKSGSPGSRTHPQRFVCFRSCTDKHQLEEAYVSAFYDIV